jgi:hypothetical protein
MFTNPDTKQQRSSTMSREGQEPNTRGGQEPNTKDAPQQASDAMSRDGQEPNTGNRSTNDDEEE